MTHHGEFIERFEELHSLSVSKSCEDSSMFCPLMLE